MNDSGAVTIFRWKIVSNHKKMTDNQLLSWYTLNRKMHLKQTPRRTGLRTYMNTIRSTYFITIMLPDTVNENVYAVRTGTQFIVPFTHH